MKKKCKGCGRTFFDDRANVKFCLPECAKAEKQIKWHEHKIEKLREVQKHILVYGRPPAVDRAENLHAYSSGGVDAYRMPDEGF